MDFFAFQNHIQQHFQQQLPFVMYRQPGENEVKAQLQPNDTLEYVNDFQEKGFVFAPFDASKKPIFFSYASAEVISCTQESLELKFNNNLHKEVLGEQERYEHLVQKTVQTIQQTGIDKIVVSRKKEILKKTDAFTYFKNLLSHYPDAMVYCWYHPLIGMWMGATPETLVKTEGKRLKSMALAGTQVYKQTTEVTWGEKEKEEQAMVTRAIVDGLSSIKAVSNIQVGQPDTARAGNVLHLKTNITASFEAECLGKIIKELHPTPAVCGLPYQMAYDYILQEENYDRSFYTGYLGELNMQYQKSRNPRRRNVENSAYQSVATQTNLYVNLRCMQIFKDRLEIYVGGGITKDSIPQAEWEETQRKAETMQKVL